MRNSVENRGITIPQFANLKLYANGFILSVTLHINGELLPYLKDSVNCQKDGFNLEAFYYKGKYYASIRKSYRYDSLSEARLCGISRKMLEWLQICIRCAKIEQLKFEVERLKNGLF